MLFSTLHNRSVKTVITSLVLVGAMLLAVSTQPTRANMRLGPDYSAHDFGMQQQDGWVAIKTDEGILFVWNVRGLYFTLLIKGKEIKPVNDPEHIFFMVDGKALQIQLAPIKDFAPDAKEKKLDDTSILAAHRDWESKFIEELLHSKLKVQTFNTKLSNGGNASMWQFDMPEAMNTEAKKQLYLTVVSKDYVLLLNSEATATISDTELRKFLLDTIATLKTYPTPIDVKALSDSIRKGTAP
ncbi:MAG TPA: hypothetical protein VGO73_11440 [Pyrinomonadaceae bacterium]|nr:hypothetical protein [Pyrinomonadaceae bacterium]